MNLENHFISQFSSVNIGDDGAFIDGYVYSKDAFFENVHFKTKWMSYYQIGAKSMLVNISDAIAMNAKPVYALLAVAMPKSITKDQIKDLVRGFEDTAREYGIEIIGGDTIANNKLDISVTIISKVKNLFLERVSGKMIFLLTQGNLEEVKKILINFYVVEKLIKNRSLLT